MTMRFPTSTEYAPRDSLRVTVRGRSKLMLRRSWTAPRCAATRLRGWGSAERAAMRAPREPASGQDQPRLIGEGALERGSHRPGPGAGRGVVVPNEPPCVLTSTYTY